MNKQRKVMSVFNGSEMQKYFLLITKEAQEVVYKEFIKATGMEVSIDDFLREIKNIPEVKEMIQEMILTSISNLDWEEAFAISFYNTNKKYGYIN